MCGQAAVQLRLHLGRHGYALGVLGDVVPQVLHVLNLLGGGQLLEGGVHGRSIAPRPLVGDGGLAGRRLLPGPAPDLNALAGAAFDITSLY